jgi:hypothetical protein
MKDPMTTKRPKTTKTTRTTKPVIGPLTQGQLGQLLGTSQQRISQLLKEGTFSALKSGKLDPFVAVPAYCRAIRKVPDAGMTKIRDLRAEALKFQLERERGEWMRSRQVGEEFDFIYAELCAALIGLPAASTRDLGVRKAIERNLGFACERFKAKLNEVANGGLEETDDAGGDVDED